MSNHTPGKWEYFRNGNGIFSVADERGVIIADFYTNGIKDPEANARLTAYAPDMYEAIGLLKWALKVTGAFLSEKGYDSASAIEITDSVDRLIGLIDGKEEG